MEILGIKYLDVLTKYEKKVRSEIKKTLYQLVNELSNPDIVIVEGFKNEKHSKIEIINDNSDSSNYLFPHLKNIIGIVSDSKIQTSIDQFKKNEIDIIANFILKKT